MKKNNKTLMIIIIFIIIILNVAILVIIESNRNPEELTISQATERVQGYFRRLYNLDVSIIDISYDQVGEHDYLNVVTVSDGETEYKLILNKNNKPISDNVSALKTIKNIDISSFDNKIRRLGLKRHEYYDLEVFTSLHDLCYRVYFSVVSVDLPKNESKDGIYSLLGELRNEGIDNFVIYIDTPSFLLPKNDFGYGVYGLRLTGISFETDIDSASFEKKFYSFVDQIYWDKQKFDEKILQLTQMGYQNVCFFISKWDDGNTLEIVLYCESNNSLSDEPAIVLLKEMDESYFRVVDNEIKYTLQHIYN
jgi:hypothetical protein